MNFSQSFAEELSKIEAYLKKQLPAVYDNAGYTQLVDAMNYSLHSGGKRFRPLLCALTARALGKDIEVVLPYAAAVEMVHTYSLIHDDLPAMDNDDERRGQPTNHKVYGEATAILAGDALLTLAFELIADNYKESPHQALRAIAILTKASGYCGMVGGQAMDLLAQSGEALSDNDIELTHQLKTASLIQAAVCGSAILCDANEEQMKDLDLFGRSLGFAFQLADDLLDHSHDQPELSGFPKHLGLEKTKEILQDSTQDAMIGLRRFCDEAQPLRDITQYNLSRTV